MGSLQRKLERRKLFERARNRWRRNMPKRVNYNSAVPFDFRENPNVASYKPSY